MKAFPNYRECLFVSFHNIGKRVKTDMQEFLCYIRFFVNDSCLCLKRLQNALYQRFSIEYQVEIKII
jgi:hypothetical protein